MVERPDDAKYFVMKAEVGMWPSPVTGLLLSCAKVMRNDR